MNQSLAHQTARYGAVGLVVYAADYALYALLAALMPAAYLAANVAGKAAGAALGFVLHKHVTFSWAQRDGARRQATAYLALFLFNILLSNALLWLLVTGFGLPKLVSRVPTDLIVIAVSFVGGRLWVYRPA